ncbi:apolipoprotein N-acyltransferase [Qipengyuania sp. 6B39]|uniref:apolipoprotein N-acyltransferase n=1 Tax=Qipengyuania proteolytica TaxID=2867239 RepID=UPI001C8926A4|nr:apolipoprotein N-acyltransferase [Qipengyuania proteolytica]MBX7494388.1 apolipoprotein N-acyltransferase [Qipengyuania proteolytica]
MDTLPGFARRHPNWVALLLGALAALGFQPLQLWPLALAAMGGFALLVAHSSTRKAAFRLGWLFGVAHFTVTNNWIATAFTYQAEMPAVLGWVAVPLLSLYLAVYPGLAALLAKAIVRDARLPAFALALGASWVLAEWLRSWVFTGYAWGPFSLALMGPMDRTGLGFLLPFTGTYALSGIAVAVSVLLAWLALGRRWLVLAMSAAVLAAGIYWPAGKGEEGDLPLTLVQPNLRQEEIDDPSKFEDQFQTLAKLSMPLQRLERRLVLWPESGVPDYLRDGYPQRYYDQMTAGGDPVFARKRIGSVIGRDALLLTGLVDLEIGIEDGRLRAVGAYNAITSIDPQGNLGRRYAKAHLVPYGEYLALRWLLEPLGASRLVAGTIDFIPGPGPRTQDLGLFGKAGMQICYEIIFSGEVVDPANRPDYIFNPSNDGWFGSWGPPQHLGQSRMRAAEEGLPVLRSTTTGISAVVDARGVVREHLGRHVAGRIDTLVPPAAAPTLFAKLGHWLTLVWGIALLAGSLVVMRRRGGYATSHT